MALVLWWSCCYEPKRGLSHGVSISLSHGIIFSTIIWGKQKTVCSPSIGRKANCESMSPARVIKATKGQSPDQKSAIYFLSCERTHGWIHKHGRNGTEQHPV